MRQEPDIATHEDQGEPMEQVANWRAEDFDLDTTVMSCDFNLYSQSLVIFSDFWKYAMLPFQGCIFLVNIDPSAHPEHEPCQICIIVLIDCIQQVRNFGFVSEIHVLHPTTIGCRGFLLGPYFIKN